jgi:hypothetical protein
MIVAAILAMAGCKDIANQPLPSGTFDPSTVNNRAGARSLALTARVQFQFAIAEYIPISGLITDELQSNTRGVARANNALPDAYTALDARFLPQGQNSGFLQATSDNLYALLQQTRAITNQAIGALRAYDPDSSTAARGELYAQQAYAEVMLADLYCSGVPLSTSDFQGDFTYKPGSSTTDVYRHAVTLFDTAITLAGDSARIVNFASIGKARALVAMGQYAPAAQAINAVPVDYVYALPIVTCRSVTVRCASYPTLQAYFNLASEASASDREGGVGLPYRSIGDPRSAALAAPIGTVNQNAVYFPTKFTLGGLSHIAIASGVEAQLIAAEAALAGGSGAWLDVLNALRTTGSYTGVDTITTIVNDPSHPEASDTTYRYDTAWVAGTGGVGHLGPLQDPGTTTARVDLLFRERGFWLYLTGTREGDLRRLLHNYNRNKDDIYPHGAYPVLGSYGDYVDTPIPLSGTSSELPNPYFNGCLSRD